MNRNIDYIIDEDSAGLRVEQFLRRKRYSGQNLSEIKRMPKSILVNGVHYYMRQELSTGDHLQVRICETQNSEKIPPTKLPLDIIYEDEGFSGGNINRPKFQKLLSDIKKEKFDILICYRLDRISRNVSDFSTTLEELQSYGVDFISIKEQFDTTTPMGRAMIYIASVFAQLERETIAERVRDNMVELAKSGKWSGGRTPLGFDSESSSYIDEEGNERKLVKLVKNDEELQLVNLIYDTYLREGSLHKTEVYFASHNIKSNRNILLEKTSLKVILNNPVYAISSPELKRWLEDCLLYTSPSPRDRG